MVLYQTRRYIIWCGEIKNVPETRITACEVHKSRTGQKTNLFVIGKPEEHCRLLPLKAVAMITRAIYVVELTLWVASHALVSECDYYKYVSWFLFLRCTYYWWSFWNISHIWTSIGFTFISPYSTIQWNIRYQ